MYILQKRAVVGRAVLLFALLCAATAGNCFAQAAASSTEIGPISAQRGRGEVKVTINLNGAVQRPRIERLVQPDRIALDFLGTTPKSGFQRIRVQMPSLSMIRTSLYRTDDNGRPVTRIVLDLVGRCEFKTSSSAMEFVVTLPEACAASPATLPKASPNSNVTRSKGVPPPDATSGPNEPNTLKAISYSDTQGRTDVVLSFHTMAQPRTTRLENPRRLVLDFPKAVFGLGLRSPFSRKPDIPYINLIRSSLFQAVPPTIRVVLEETNDAPRPQISVVGTNVEIHYLGSSIASRSQPPKIDLPPQAASATQKASVVSSQVEHSSQPTQGISATKPTITYSNGLLSIDAEDAPLADVLFAIGEKTGAGIQMPMSDGMLDRVALKMGPATPRQLLTTLLEGSRYTYFIVEDGSGGLQKVILTPKQ